MTKLKLCPFCGKEVKIKVTHDDHYVIECDNCNSSTSFPYLHLRDDIVNAWNNRPSPWHTDIPTEEDWYLCQLYNDGNWYRHDLYKADYFSIIDRKPCWSNHEDWNEYPLIAWQKIEPYKEKENERKS